MEIKTFHIKNSQNFQIKPNLEKLKLRRSSQVTERIVQVRSLSRKPSTKYLRCLDRLVSSFNSPPNTNVIKYTRYDHCCSKAWMFNYDKPSRNVQCQQRKTAVESRESCCSSCALSSNGRNEKWCNGTFMSNDFIELKHETTFAFLSPLNELPLFSRDPSYLRSYCSDMQFKSIASFPLVNALRRFYFSFHHPKSSLDILFMNNLGRCSFTGN